MSMLNIGMSGLTSSMAALNATSNNVANAMVPGYSRQQVMLSSVGGGIYGSGAGVQIDGVRRISDQYEVAQLWNTTSGVGYAKVKSSYYGQVEQIFGSKGNNISFGLDQLFASLNSALEQPSDIAYRQGVLSEAKAMGQRFNSISQSLNSQLTQIEGQIGASAKEINSQLETIAQFNEEIQRSGADVPASLLDARDAAIDDLSQLVDIRVTEDANGMVNISLAQGQPLLSGTTASTLEVKPDPSNPALSTITIKFGDSSFPLDETAGGSLGALLDYRDNSLMESMAFTNEMAMTFADEFNAILAGGTDLGGNTPTQDLFIYDPTNPAGSIKVTDGFTAEMLAFGQSGAPGDNSNLKELIELANTEFTFDSIGVTASMGDAYSSIVGKLGSESRQAQVSEDTALSLQREAQSQWASTSGVNMDEEAVNLIIYQQSYQANAKVISTADQLFQTILNI
ncbi:flagellar hook-associated protein FlgK [Shewanella eurypsychrophilus]|uniref:Flagellar hook-associated protein 1 n=1 Tax=Shewanella eurypsychrophilus TaxID=2593656 RepID=A0ABX6V2F8_9GAMM|nr:MULTISPECIES: flagellar hook-associated protein FlgK [Shewanella]QFU20470.1 flagellar hook-associated protein FlgK [Shewanella sp. YLB-09]QFU20751.1 flagellar hook-associated protein FlgK [Shewanella sp. YLB-09]QPG56047.1 flagellar hook-associated protein FlgK [Shewanella eurypsychrophilus]